MMTMEWTIQLTIHANDCCTTANSFTTTPHICIEMNKEEVPVFTMENEGVARKLSSLSEGVFI